MHRLHSAQPDYERLLLLARNKVIIKAQDTTQTEDGKPVNNQMIKYIHQIWFHLKFNNHQVSHVFRQCKAYTNTKLRNITISYS